MARPGLPPGACPHRTCCRTPCRLKALRTCYRTWRRRGSRSRIQKPAAVRNRSWWRGGWLWRRAGCQPGVGSALHAEYSAYRCSTFVAKVSHGSSCCSVCLLSRIPLGGRDAGATKILIGFESGRAPDAAVSNRFDEEIFIKIPTVGQSPSLAPQTESFLSFYGSTLYSVDIPASMWSSM